MVRRLIFLLLLLQLSTMTFAMSLRTITLRDTVGKPVVVVPDSLYLQDSIEVFRSYEKEKASFKTLKIVGGITAGIIAIRNALRTNGYGMLISGLLSIGLLISALKKNKKVKTYDELLKAKERRATRKEGNPKWNNAWSYSLFFGFIGMAALIAFEAFSLTLLASIPAICTLIALFMFFIGFKGKYSSKKQKNRGILKGLIGIFLPFFPVLLLILLIFTGVIQLGE